MNCNKQPVGGPRVQKVEGDQSPWLLCSAYAPSQSLTKRDTDRPLNQSMSDCYQMPSHLIQPVVTEKKRVVLVVQTRDRKVAGLTPSWGGYQVLFYIAHTLVRGRLFRTTTTSLNFYWMAAATRCAHACICQRDGISLHQVVCSRSTTANEAQNNSNIHHSLVDCCPIDAVLIQQSLQFVDPCPQLPIFLK